MLLTVLLTVTPAMAQRNPASLGVQAAMVADSVSGGDTASGGNGGLFVRSDAAWSGGRTRVTWRLDSSSQIRRAPGGGSAAWDQQSARAAVTLRSTRVTTIGVSGGLQWSPRLSVEFPQPDGSDRSTIPAIEIPTNSVTARFGGRLTHAFTRQRSGDAEYMLERGAAGGRTILTQRAAAGVRQQLGREFALILKQSATRRGYSNASGDESNESFETTVGLARRIGGTTSLTAALIPSLFRPDGSNPDHGSSFRLGGGASVERRWSAGWRTIVGVQQSLLSGEGYSTPVYARSIGGSAVGRLGPLALTGSVSRVVGGRTAEGNRSSGGHSLIVTVSQPLPRRAAIAVEFQRTRVQQAAPAAAAGANHLRDTRLRVAMAVGLSRR